MTDYALDNSWDRAKRRLARLEEYLDPLTQRRMMKLKICAGLKCLEIGGGGGSVATWLCEQVGPTGRVVATDINVQFLREIKRSNFEFRQHDITVNSLPQSEFDFVHARWLLHHLSEPEHAIRRMIKALRPGGWILLEEVDFFPVHASSSKAYSDFMTALTSVVVRAPGCGCFWARALPDLVAGMGLLQVGGEGDFSILQGGSPIAEFYALTADQMRERMLKSGVQSTRQLDHALGLLNDPGFWAFGGGGVAVWGQRPT